VKLTPGVSSAGSKLALGAAKLLIWQWLVETALPDPESVPPVDELLRGLTAMLGWFSPWCGSTQSAAVTQRILGIRIWESVSASTGPVIPMNGGQGVVSGAHWAAVIEAMP